MNQKMYMVQGSLKDIFTSSEREVIVSGPHNTGKSRACLEKVDLMSRMRPGSSSLILRRHFRELLADEAVQFELDVLGNDPYVKVDHFTHVYQYPNGSTVMMAGLDTTFQMGRKFNLIYCPSVLELEERDWLELIDFSEQIIGECNPPASEHWLPFRAMAPRGVQHIYSSHEDNPLMFDRTAREYTSYGVRYLQLLDQLTQRERRRLKYGMWMTV